MSDRTDINVYIVLKLMLTNLSSKITLSHIQVSGKSLRIVGAIGAVEKPPNPNETSSCAIGPGAGAAPISATLANATA